MLAKNNSILMFPEGTRSATGTMGSFKDGAFQLAKEAQTDIVPIVLDGTAELVPKGGFIFNRKITIPVFVEVPIPYSVIEKLTIKELRELVRTKMVARLSMLRQQGDE
jgi:1-acyl-sn-glycerol-3-phosphate acyltransferase